MLEARFHINMFGSWVINSRINQEGISSYIYFRSNKVNELR